jgi:tetratricopeptide (TPR) repeat protein
MDKDQHHIRNEGLVQAQNIAHYQYITQHFHETEDASLSLVKPERVWNVPFSRNPVFTGREESLAQLRTCFQTDHTAAPSRPQAVSGLGGVGKTQIALEYAHRYRQEYQTVLWSRADTREALISGYVAIAHVLGLPQKDEQDQGLAVNAVLRWLTMQDRWLLILDNADDLAIMREFLPPVSGGHILLTTRAQALGTLAHRIEIDTMDLDVGAQLLLRRANLIEQDALLETALPSDISLAREVSEELGGLPLALDQAGAYLEETGENLPGYLSIFKEERAILLKRRGGFASDHLPVATTWNLAFENIEMNNSAAIELIRLFAFLAPDAIPEELLTQTAHHLGPVLHPLITKQIRFNEAIKTLLDYSLIQRNTTTKTLSIHRLVQAIIRDEMGKTKQFLWEERVIHMIYAIFPFKGSTQWILGQRYLPHALLAIEYIDRWQLTFVEARALLLNLGTYLYKHGQESKAEYLLQRALTLSEKIIGSDRLSYLALCLNNLASLYRTQDRLEQAEYLLRRALTLNEKILGLEDVAIADNLNNLANVYLEQDKLEQAKPLLQRAIAIREKALGFDHPGIVGHLCNLANIYRVQDNLEQAELVFQRALAIQDQHLDLNHLDRTGVLQGLAFLCEQRGNFEEAELFHQRALTIYKKVLGTEHPDTIVAQKALIEAQHKI